MAKRKLSEKQLAALREHAIKPGEVRNPTGRNNWSAMRERYRELIDGKLEDLVAELVRIAERGEDDKVRVQAIAKTLGPIIDVRSVELSGPGGAPLNFADIAKRAGEEDE